MMSPKWCISFVRLLCLARRVKGGNSWNNLRNATDCHEKSNKYVCSRLGDFEGRIDTKPNEKL